MRASAISLHLPLCRAQQIIPFRRICAPSFNQPIIILFIVWYLGYEAILFVDNSFIYPTSHAANLFRTVWFTTHKTSWSSILIPSFILLHKPCDFSNANFWWKKIIWTLIHRNEYIRRGVLRCKETCVISIIKTPTHQHTMANLLKPMSLTPSE